MDGGTKTRYSGVFLPQLFTVKLLTAQYHVTFYAYFRGKGSQPITKVHLRGPVVSSNWFNQEVVDDGEMTYLIG